MKTVDNEYLKLMEISPEEKSKRGILARLYGPCASTIKSTRNGRFYENSLWEEVFTKNEIVKELFNMGGIPGEAQHPTDRQELDVEKIAIMMPEPPRKDEKTGLLMAYFDIQDTPCGRIAYQLAKYGFKLGVSSRGSGDTYTNEKGEETVDPTSYDFTAFDLVIIPAVKEARMSMVEGLDTKNAQLRKALTEALDQANPTERKIMEETLKDLNIVVNTPNKGDNINENLSSKAEAANDGADLAKEFLNAIKENKELVKQTKDLQEKLSVCYTKEAKYDESEAAYKERIKTLEEALNEAKKDSALIESLNEQIRIKNAVIEKLHKTSTSVAATKNNLTESVTKKDAQIADLQHTVASLNESIAKSEKDASAKIQALNESLEEQKKDAAIKRTEITTKLQKANELTERYKNVAKLAVDRYIGEKAVMLGVDKKEIKAKLPENYSFDDIDRLCESLKSYHLNIDSLPFDARKGQKVRMTVTESYDPIKTAAGLKATGSQFDDDCDEDLMNLARTQRN